MWIKHWWADWDCTSAVSSTLPWWGIGLQNKKMSQRGKKWETDEREDKLVLIWWGAPSNFTLLIALKSNRNIQPPLHTNTQILYLADAACCHHSNFPPLTSSNELTFLGLVCTNILHEHTQTQNIWRMPDHWAIQQSKETLRFHATVAMSLHTVANYG